jgi:hypothetical protein
MNDSGLKVTDYRPADIVLTRSSGWAGKLIRFGTQQRGEGRSMVSHAGLILDGSGTLIEAIFAGVQIHDLERCYQGREDLVSIWRPINISADERQQICDRATTYNGDTYGYGKIVLHTLDGLLGKLGIPPVFKRLSWLDDFPICSYLVAQAYADIGFEFGVSAKLASPDDIWDFVNCNPSKYICIRKLSKL